MTLPNPVVGTSRLGSQSQFENSSPLWEDFTTKSTKLHSCLRATIQAVSAFLDAFQKIADAATSTKGATKDIGTALTRICLRHKALEAKLKTFTSSILDSLIIPLQERLEDWKRTTANLDKEHSKEYKRGRSELKKRTIETLRLQKKCRKGGLNHGAMSSSFAGTLTRSSVNGNTSSMSSSSGGESIYHQGFTGGNRDLQRMLEMAIKDTNEKRQFFEETEKQAIRTALIEERSRFCLFVAFFKPVIDEEIALVSELTHVQEAMQQLEKHSVDPFGLPLSSEQVIADLKGSCDSGTWSFQTPPSSPSSLGSRKSSMCSISSANSSSSGSGHSPTNSLPQRVISTQQACPIRHPTGPLRFASASSRDSGFTSQDALFSRMPLAFQDQQKGEVQSEGSNTNSNGSSNSSTPSSPCPPGTASTTNATWPNLQDSIQFERAACAIMNERPHTISSAYEREHQRPQLTVYTFQGPVGESSSHPVTPTSNSATPLVESGHIQGPLYQNSSEIYGILRGRSESKPPVPKRGSSLERNPSDLSTPSGDFPPNCPSGIKTTKSQKRDSGSRPLPALPDFNQSSPDMIVPQPVYVNMHELNQMAAAKKLQQQHSLEPHAELPPPPPELIDQFNKGDRLGCSIQKMELRGPSDMIDDSRSPSITGTIVCSTGSGSSIGSSVTAIDVTEVYEKLESHSATVLPEKPQPPIRRSSSISTSTSRNTSNASSPTNSTTPYLFVNQLHGQNQIGNRERSNGNYLSGLQTTQSPIPSNEVTSSRSTEQLPPPPESLMMSSINNQKATYPLGELTKHVSVAETIKSLTEKNHQPVSPNMVRRSSCAKQIEDQDNMRNYGSSTPSINIPKEKERSNLMEVLNQKLAQGLNQPIYGHIGHPLSHPKQGQQLHHQQSLPNQLYQQQLANQQATSQSATNSPKHPRRFSEELLKTTATFVQTRVLGNKTPPPLVSSKEIFVQTLNAKLSQMRVGSPPTERRQSSPTLKTSFASKLVASVSHHHHHHSKSNEMSRAYRVRQWISSKTISDPNLCRESLMDQIRRGTKLRHTRTINDRSAPRIH